jgi:Uma2 family endonuclease
MRTMAEFLAWAADPTARHECGRGETLAMAGGTARRRRVALHLASRITAHVDGTPCQAFARSVRARLAEAYLDPDVMGTCGKAQADDTQTIAGPELIIEVRSPRTTGYDKQDKFILYRAWATLRK